LVSVFDASFEADIKVVASTLTWYICYYFVCNR